MTDRAITFDFHNTLAECPEWFELEVRRLPSAFLSRWAPEQGRSLDVSLLADADARYRALRRDIIDHGNELTAEECLDRVFRAMGLDVPFADLESGVAAVMREALAGASPVPGAVDAVLAIHRARVPIGVVSSAVYHPFLEWTLEAFGIRHALAAVITSASARFYKSRPEIYWHAADLLGAPPERMVHVGDSLRFDVGGASRAGLGTVWLDRDGAARPEPSVVPDLTLTTLEDAAPEILGVLAARQPGAGDDDG
jgi:FMN phosphatase YigB (HAD superfamily)